MLEASIAPKPSGRPTFPNIQMVEWRNSGIGNTENGLLNFLHFQVGRLAAREISPVAASSLHIHYYPTKTLFFHKK